jgi:hypothetical protein
MNNKLYISLQSSIIGWHNPKLHHGLTAEQFLTAYEKRLETKPTAQWHQYLELLQADRYYFLHFIRQTLLHNKRVL